MSIVSSIFDGMGGNRAINPLSKMNAPDIRENGFNNPIIRMNWEKTNYLENATAIRQSVLRSNQGGAFGVMPCKGAPSVGFAGGNRRTLRRQPVSYFGGLYPHQGYARNQPMGLATLAGKPMNLPLMPIADSFNAGLNSRLGQPN